MERSSADWNLMYIKLALHCWNLCLDRTRAWNIHERIGTKGTILGTWILLEPIFRRS
jgi:hypothetical protein